MTDTTKKKILKWFWGIIIGGMSLVALLLVAVCVFAKIPSFEELENPDNKLATQVLDEDGELLCTFHIENRTYVSYEELSPHLVHAAVATEDVRFYRHSGIDMRGLARVFVKTLLMNNSSQGGGSTITQQLAKTLYPRPENSNKLKMVWIKLKEWVTAVKIEKNYTKEEIVDMYLNSIFFGSGAYGVKAAAETFFGKLPSELTIEESAMLVGMVNKPTRYNPVLNPDKALTRRNFVLGQMEKAGYFDDEAKAAGVKTTAFRDSLRALPIVTDYHIQDHNSGFAPYFRDMLRRTMNATKPKRSDYAYVEDYRADSTLWVNDDLYGWLNKNKKTTGESYDLDRDGLKIYTTINKKMQRYAEEAVAQHMSSQQKLFDREMKHLKNAPFANDVDQAQVNRLMKNARKWSDRYRLQKKAGLSDAEIFKQFSEPTKMRVFAWKNGKESYIDTLMTPDDSIKYYKGIMRAGFMAIEPGTGHIKAYVGGPNYRYFKYDNVRQGKRQIGSTVKPFLYTLAMLPDNGFTPCTKVLNEYQTVDLPNGTSWTPRSTDKAEWIGKTVTLKWGLQMSSNNISTYLIKRLGPESLVALMHQMGIGSHIEAVHPLCVGSADLSVYEMVAAYNTFPSEGSYIQPKCVTRIEDNQGNEISEFATHSEVTIGARTAFIMVNMMRGVVDGGTGNRLRTVYGLKGQIAGKTGTTNGNSDAWFIGYTPTITAGVWVGAEDRDVHFTSGALGQGSAAALPIWGIWMQKCLKDGTLGISEMDMFMAPRGEGFDFGCTGGDDTTITEEEREDYYFE